MKAKGLLYTLGTFLLAMATLLWIEPLAAQVVGPAALSNPEFELSANATVHSSAADHADGSFTSVGGQPRHGSTVNPRTDTNVTAHTSATANLVIDPWTATASGGANGTITPPSRTVNPGETTTFTVTPATNYHASVSGCGGSLSGTTYTTGPMTADCAVSASFAINTYTVTANAGANGTITPSSQTVNHGIKIAFTVTPANGYHASVSGCGGNLNGTNYITGPITANCTISANFPINISTAPLPNPNLQLSANGIVRAIARQPDGGIVFGGEFSSVNGVARRNIARLLADGTLDPDWNPSADGRVHALAADSSGAVYVGGNFFHVGGQFRNRIAKLAGSGTGTADASWNPSADNVVVALAVDSSGAVYVGGEFFTTIGGQSRNRIAKLSGSGTGAADADWNPTSNGQVRALAVDSSSGAVYAGGDFSAIGGASRRRIAKLSGSGTGAADPSWNPSADHTVYALAVDSSGAVYAGGHFIFIGDQSRNYVARLSGSGAGAVDASWNPSANNRVNALAVDSSGAVYVGGFFTSIGGQTRNRLARLAGETGAVDASWNPSANGDVNALSLDSSGAVYAGGAFTAISGQPRDRIAALPAPESWTLTYSAGANGSISGPSPQTVSHGGSGTAVTAVADTGYRFMQWSDGSMVNPRTDMAVTAPISVEASFVIDTWSVTASAGANGTITPMMQTVNSGATTTFTVTPTSGYHAIVSGCGGRLSGTTYTTGPIITDCAVSASFPSDTSNLPLPNPNLQLSAGGMVRAIVRQPDGGTIFGGLFTAVNGVARGNIARLRADGTLDPNWNPSASGSVYALALDGSGAVYAGGNFTMISGQARNRLAKLAGSGTGGVDASWNPSVSGIVYALAVDSSGAVYAGGSFTTVGNSPRSYIAKLAGNGVGAVDASWDPAANDIVFALAVDGNDAVYAGGSFTTIGNSPRRSMAKLSGSGTGAADASWNPSANGSVFALALDSRGAVYTGGAFTAIGGQSRNFIAKLSGSGTGEADASWNPSTNGRVYALAADSSGGVYAGGAFIAIGEHTRNRIARLSGSGTGAADASWNPSANGIVYALAVDSSGAILAGGEFTSIGGQPRDRIAALSAPVYRLTYTAGANGSISGPSPQTVNPGESGTAVTAVADSGYHFEQWSDGSTANPRADTNVTANISVTASFAIDTWTVTASAGANGTITPTTQTVNHGATTTFAVTPATGYHAIVSGCGGSLSGTTWTTAPITADCVVSASFVINTYTVTASGGTNGTITPPSQTVSHGATTTFTVTPAIDHHAIVSGCGGSLSGNVYTTGSITADCVVTASFAINTHTVTATGGANGTITPPSQTVNHGATTTFAVAPATGYHASVSGCGGSLSGNVYTTGSITADCAVTASFAINTYTVTASAGANGTITPPSQTVNHGAATTFTVTPTSGYHASVTGCNGNLSGTTYTTGAITTDCAVTASFAINTYMLTYSAGTNGTISGASPQTVDHGASGTSVTAVANAGYHFVQWSDGSTANPRVDSSVSADISVTASFAINTYTVTATAGANGTITPPTQSVEHDAAASFTVTPDANHHVVSVIGDTCTPVRGSGNVWSASKITSTCAVTATFAIDTHEVTASATGNGTITPPTQSVEHDAAASFTVTPNANHHVVSVIGDTCTPVRGSGNAWSAPNIISACAVTATFAIDTYEVTSSASGNGTITPPTQSVDHAAAANFTVTPDANHHVVSVMGDTCTPVRGSGNAWSASNITSACAVTATFALVTHQVTANAIGSGLVTPSTQPVNHGATASLTVSPASGHQIANLSGAGCAVSHVSGETWITDAITTDCAITAIFTALPPDLVLTIDDGREYARYGQLLTYDVTLRNRGDGAVRSASIAMVLPPQLEASGTTWICTNGGGGATCTASGEGALEDEGIVLPAGRSLTWAVTAPIRQNAAGDGIETTVEASTGAISATASDHTRLVILRSGFDFAESDGTQGVFVDLAQCDAGPAQAIDDTFLQVLALPSAKAGFETLLVARSASGAGFRLERVTLGAAQVRLVAVATNGSETASEWAPVEPGATLALAAIASANGQRLLLLEGALSSLSLELPPSAGTDGSSMQVRIFVGGGGTTGTPACPK